MMSEPMPGPQGWTPRPVLSLQHGGLAAGPLGPPVAEPGGGQVQDEV